MLGEYGEGMWLSLLLLGGTIGLVLLLAWWVHRHQRDIDDELPREYRDPPPFQWQGPL